MIFKIVAYRLKQIFMDILEFKLVSVATYLIVAVTSSEILKAKQKLGVTFNSDKILPNIQN